MQKFSQGNALIVPAGSQGGSDNHITCHHLIILNRESGDAYMAHIWNGGYDGLSHAQIRKLDIFTKSFGEKTAIIITGDNSVSVKDTLRELNKRHIPIIETIQLESGRGRWDVAYDSQDRSVTVTDEYQKLLYYNTPFPELIETDKKFAGKSDNERAIMQLSSYHNPETGELSAEVVATVRKILRQTDPADNAVTLQASLLNIFMEQREQATGYDRLSDYLSEYPGTLSEINYTDNELVLRKIIGEYACASYEKAGIDFAQVKITADAIAALLENYPNLMIQIASGLKQSQPTQSL